VASEHNLSVVLEVVEKEKKYELQVGGGKVKEEICGNCFWYMGDGTNENFCGQDESSYYGELVSEDDTCDLCEVFEDK